MQIRVLRTYLKKIYFLYIKERVIFISLTLLGDVPSFN